MDATNVRVQAPSPIIFVCGGEITSVSEPKPKSLRDGFLKILDFPPLKNARAILAEHINVFYISRQTYKDLLEFETDLAQITELVLLFCESEGSLAELGAFAMTEEIHQRVLVVMRDKHYKQDSFVMLGPILSLKNRYGERVVYVVDDDDINIVGTKYDELNVSTLEKRLTKPIAERLGSAKEPTTFDKNRSGHIIKFIVGLIQEYGALSFDEIQKMLLSVEIDLNSDKLLSYLLCAEAVEWIQSDKKGSDVYYFSRSLKSDASQNIFNSKIPEKSKPVRRMAVRAHWKETDPDRFRGIVKYSGEKA